MTSRALRRRLMYATGALVVVLAVLLLRAAQLAVLQAIPLQQKAVRQHQAHLRLPPQRGPILDRNGDLLAITRESAAVYVRPRQLTAPREQLARVAGLLELPVDHVLVKASSTAPFVYLDRQVSLERWSAVEELRLPGIGSEPARQRYYPYGPLAGQVLGFINIDGQGLEGVERALDAVLRGEVDALDVERDARGRRIAVDGKGRTLPRVGARVELTLDAALQHLVESELERTTRAFAADGAMAVVMAPDSGEILAMATVPRVDPNAFGGTPAAQRRNRVITDFYEPGSTFKAFLAAAALEEGVIRPSDRVFCEHGAYGIGRRVIHDHHAYGTLTFAQVIGHSSNIGCAKVAERLGAERYSAAIARFGFGKATGVGLPGESTGQVRPGSKWGRIHLATTAFGQGIAVTPLQLTRAFAAIANGGLLLRPHIVRRIIGEDGEVQYVAKREIERRVISPVTAATVTAMLRGAVEDGTGKSARIEGFSVAGKTGTAQKVDATGRYSKRDRMASFAGFVPAEAPRLVILVMVDTPRRATYGGIVAAPAFRAIAAFGLDRMGVRAPVPDIPGLPADEPAPAPPLDSPALVGAPSFIGLSMRDALVQAQQLGWEVRVAGSGHVVEQTPPPGGVLQAPEIALKFGSVIR